MWNVNGGRREEEGPGEANRTLRARTIDRQHPVTSGPVIMSETRGEQCETSVNGTVNNVREESKMNEEGNGPGTRLTQF